MINNEEIWKDIEGYDGKYMISSFGRVKSIWRNNQYKSQIGSPTFLTPTTHKQGYLWVSLVKDGKSKAHFIHRLVAQAFIPNPDNLPQVNHKDEDKTNNMVWVNEDGSIDYDKSNLEWCDAKYNSNYGTRNERCKKKIAKPIIQTTLDGKFVKEYSSMSEAEKIDGYDSAYISLVCNGKRKSAYGYKWHFKEIHNKQQGNTTVADVLRVLAELLEEKEDNDED